MVGSPTPRPMASTYDPGSRRPRPATSHTGTSAAAAATAARPLPIDATTTSVEQASASSTTRSARRMAASIASGTSGSTSTPARSIARTRRPPSSPAITASTDTLPQRRSARAVIAGYPTVITAASSGRRSASRAGVASRSISLRPGPRRVERPPAWRAGGRTATTAARTSGCARRGCDTAARARSAPDPSLVRASTVSATITAGSAPPLLATWRSRSIGCTGTSCSDACVAVDACRALLPSHLVAKDPPADLVLTPLGGEARPLSEWLTTFHLATVALDPYTNESAWILPTATRILEGLRGSDARVNFLVTARKTTPGRSSARSSKQFLVFVDDDRSVVKALGLETLPAFVFIRVDSTVPAAAEGWNPAEWRAVAETVAATTAWQPPDIPMPRRPRPVPRHPRPR